MKEKTDLYKLILTFTFLICIGSAPNLFAQVDSLDYDEEYSEEEDSMMLETPKYWSFGGYLKFMQTVIVQESDNKWVTDNLLHNRLNFSWYPTDKFTFNASLRNRLIYGELYEMIPGYKDYIDQDYGYFDLSASLADDTSFLLHSTVDRLYFDYTHGKFQATIGRQRINWGTNLVWNPNDLFNSFSYFDFDYEERPGTDAARLQYYLNYASSIEVAYALGKDWDEMALAGIWRFNKWSYDFQLLGGRMQNDYVIGGGWAGAIKGAAFRGEASYFIDAKNTMDTTGQLVVSVSSDYTFANSLYVHGGVLYNSRGKTGDAGGIDLFMNQNLTAKSLTPARWSLFTQLMYPLTPLMTVNATAIINPLDGSLFAGPSLSYSLSDNLQLALFTQMFFGDEGTEFGDYGKFFFMRIKGSF